MAGVTLLPSMLAADFARIGEQVRAGLTAGAGGMHADVMDGRFVPPITYGPKVIRTITEATGAWIDAHLMIVEPERHIDELARAGVKAVTVHVEACPHLHRVLGMIRDAGMEAGVALNPATPVTETLRYTLSLLDRVLVMSVNPGWGGQAFIPEALDKVHKVAQIARASERDIHIQVDGGVTPENVGALVAHGADELVAGTAVFKGDIDANVKAFAEAIRAGKSV
ncbi:ribulose-phosphate 3-epimerase [bacterium]|nr:ribulose-phosphate 3-epimerase [bacterium]